VRNALNTAARRKREEPTGQEFAGGACSKMRAARNGDSIQRGLGAGIFERCNAAVDAIIGGGAVL